MDGFKFFPCCDFKSGGVNNIPCSRASSPLILAVDDDEDNLLLLSYVLEPLECSLLTAADGLSALHQAQTYQPDLILLDIRLPYLDGVEVVAQLREDPKMNTIPIIAVTALARSDDRERLLLAGCTDYLSKPYMIDEIEAVVRRYLRLPTPIS
jgi:CheY-like chemotaxis protein